MEPEITLEQIIERMGQPSSLTPKEVCDYYLYLTSYYARFSVELCDVMAVVAKKEGDLVAGGETSSKAKQLASRSEEGLSMIKLKGRLKATEELIRSLKAAQKYMLEEARNTL